MKTAKKNPKSKKLKLPVKILIGLAIAIVVVYAALNVARVVPMTAIFVNNLPVLKDIPTILNDTEEYCGKDERGEEACIEVRIQDCYKIINDICYPTEEDWHQTVLEENQRVIEDGIKYCKETFGVDTYNKNTHYYNEWGEPMYWIECDLTEKYAEEHRQNEAEMNTLSTEKRTLFLNRCSAEKGDTRYSPLRCSSFATGKEKILFYASDLWA